MKIYRCDPNKAIKDGRGMDRIWMKTLKKTDNIQNRPRNILYLSLLLVVQFPKCRSHQPLLSPQLGCGALRHAGWAISLRWQSDAFGGATHAAVDEDFSRFFH